LRRGWYAAPRRRHRGVHQRGPQAARRRPGAPPGERARGPSLASLGRGAGRRERNRATPARRDQPLEPRQGPELGAAPTRTRPGGRVRPHAGDSLPACRSVRALAPRQAPARLPLRSAGGHAGLRAGARLRRARSAPDGTQAAPGIVVGIGRFLGGAFALRNVTQVDSDARPRARAATHRVDEDVVDLQPPRSLRMARLPAFQPRERVLLVLGLRDGDEWLSRLAATAALLYGTRGLY